ncbi:hypothetical protein EV363DRAFT_1297786 [Boletus edulis]|nr:hypothetical protein EV363DRAFT_1297786 [Boletus edulis]
MLRYDWMIRKRAVFHVAARQTPSQTKLYGQAPSIRTASRKDARFASGAGVAEEALAFFRGMWTFDEPLPDEAASVKGLSDCLKDFTDELARNYSELQKVNRAMEEAWFVGLKTAGRQ